MLVGYMRVSTAELQPAGIMSDTGAYTDTIFGIFHLLGFQFSPRLADIGGTRFWRVDGRADCGALDGLAAQRVNMALIVQYWDDLLRLAGIPKLGTLQTKDRPTKRAATSPPAPCSTASAANCGSATARARRTSSVPWAWW